MAKETTNHGVQETKIRLAEELVEVCRDYCKKVWVEMLNQARVPATSEWRNAENVFYPEDIQEVPATLPPLATIQASLSPPEVTKGPGKACDQG